jgi:thiol-disulfide isomerase/thioredoxin
MKYTKLYPVAILFLFALSQSVLAQKSYNIEIKFSGKDVSQKNIDVVVSKGFQNISLTKDSYNLIDEVIESSAKYTAVIISYFSSRHAPSIHRYFLVNQHCKLLVRYDNATDRISVEQTSGVLSFEDGGLRKFEQFAKAEIEASNAYAKLYKYDFTNVDSMVLVNYTNYLEAVDEKGIQFIKKYPDQVFSTWIFLELLDFPRYSKEELLNIYNKSLQPANKGTLEEGIILQRLDPNRLALNTKAPLQNKIFRDLHGSDYSISSSGGKLVLIKIWATWCEPCVAEIPRLKELHSKYKDSLEILAFSTDTNEQKLRDFIKTNEMDWINVINQPEICQAFGSDMGIPQLFLINEKGMIIYPRSGSEDWSLEKLDKTLAIQTEKQKSNN